MAKRRLLLLVPLLLALLLATGSLTAYAQPAGQTDPKADLAKLQDFWKVKVGSIVADALVPKTATSARLPGGLTRELLAKAQPDECFYGVGDPRNGPIPSTGCESGGQLKVNQAYVWGLAKSGNNVWFGTAPNVHCLVIGGYLGMTDPLVADSYVCEFGQSKWVKALPPPVQSQAAPIGDWRAPRVFTYDVSTKTLTEKTPLILADPPSAGRLNSTIGLRSAGALGEVVFLGGPGMRGGVNLFAFDTNGNFLGSANLPYTNIRKWLVVDGVLYAGVAASGGKGYVLRWKGNGSSNSGTLFAFEKVGQVDGDAAELALHEGRIFVSTWPGGEIAGGMSTAGLWMSPPVLSGGFTGPTGSDPVPKWTKVWDVTQYETDPVTAATYGGGALASFGGYLYWGTMHVPMLSALAHFEVYGAPKDQNEVTAAILGTYRAISIFRGKNFASSKPQMEVLYGESTLPTYANGAWTMKKTGMGRPRFGSSGLGNFFNNYTWAMAVYDGKLYVGTMDWSYLSSDLMNWFSNDKTGLSLGGIILSATTSYGADLFAFSSARNSATTVSKDGVGNYLNYGIRNMVSTNDALYLGMSNPMNLMTNLEDKKPEGGWELIRLKAR